MSHTLPYAPASVPKPTRLCPLALVVTALSPPAAALSIYATIASSQSLISTFDGCATGRTTAAFSLYILTPLTFLPPIAAWLLCRRTHSPTLLPRTATYAALAAWLTAHVCFFL